MQQTLYTRLLATHLLVAVVALSLVGVLSSQLFRHYYVTQSQRAMTEAGEDLAKTIGRLMSEPDAEQKISLLAHTSSEMLGGRVCVFDARGGDLVASSDLKKMGGPEGEVPACPAEGFVGVERLRVQCYPGPVLSLVAPIHAPGTDRRIGVLLLRRPLREVEATLRASTYLIGASGALAAALALFLASLASRTISRPLSDMARAASDLADGDFSARVERTGPQELRTVAASLNHMAGALSGAFAELSAERERLADILASMEEGVISLEADGSIALANQGAIRLLGADGEDMQGSKLDGIIADQALNSQVARLLAGQADSLEQTVMRGDVALLMHGTRIEAEEGGAVIVITDVTEAERLEALRREFVANASHELRAPLTTIQGFVGAVADGTAETEEEKQRCLSIALEQAALMRRLVDQLLDLSRLQAGVVPFEREWFELGGLLRGSFDALSIQASRKNVQLTLDEGELPRIHADGDRIMQVLVNLIDNAIRFTPEGSEVVVSAHVADGREPGEWMGEGKHIVVCVRDHGPGVPADELELIWERFHKTDKSRQRTDPGAGLGLAIAREIVAAHGGQVHAENASDGGAELSFSIPVESDPGST